MAPTTIQDDFDHLYTCLESDTLPPVPTVAHAFKDPEILWPEEPKSFICRAWASNAMPYQGFLPTRRADFFYGDLFKPLAYGIHDFPLVCLGPAQWRLKENLIEEWATLEDLLLYLREILAGRIVRHRSLGHCSFPSPRRYGYHHTKPTKQALKCAAARSRDAFIVMAAEISYLLALASAEIDGYKFESWPVLLTEMVGCGWADLIRNSWLVQRDAGYWSQRESASRRVGIFVNPQECDFAYFLKAYTSFGVPVWIDWGPLINPYPACDLELQVTYTFQLPPKHIRPRTRALPHFAESTYDMIRGRWRRKFYDEALDLEWKKEDSLLFPQKVSHISSGSWDEVDEGKIQYEPSLSGSVSGVSTRQWLGETWMQFFSRLEKETELMMQHESPRDARRREARDRVAGTQSYPSKTANVFVWNPVDGKDYMVRCHVSSDQVSELWDFYTSTQRRYSSFWDEWDLNHEFDPSALLDVEEQEQIHGTDDTTGPSVGPELLRPVKNNRDAWEAAYMESFKPKLRGMVPNKRCCMTLEGVIRYRFGIVWASVPSLGTTLTSVETVKADKTLKLLGCHNAPRDELSSISSGVLLNLLPGLDWLQTLSTSDASSYTGQIPRDAWDISVTCSDYLRPEHHNMTVTLVESWNESITGYEVQIKGGEEMPYKLILFRATDVMYISRLRGLPCLDDVVEDICSHGIRFLLALPILQDDANRCKAKAFYPEPSLHRPYGFVPDMSEYKKYLWRRSTLFSDPAVVRAALMHGGLIGYRSGSC